MVGRTTRQTDRKKRQVTSDFPQPSNEMYNLRQYCIILLFRIHKRLFPT